MSRKNVFVVTCLFLLVFFNAAVADVIYVHGLNVDSDEREKNLKDKLQQIVIAPHTIIFGDERKPSLTAYESMLSTGGEQVDWIVFFGHGLSSSGKIWANHNYFYPLGNLMSESNWGTIKGVLIFTCAVLDIGDFGWQKTATGYDGPDSCDAKFPDYREGYCGNYCGSYYVYNKNEVCGSDPDPGLKWAEFARRKNIKYIIGFNSSAPLIGGGGAAFAKQFFSNWMNLEKKGADDENFLKAWKQSLLFKENPEANPSASLIERSYLKRGKKGNYFYGIGRAIPESDTGKLNWISLWNPVWSDKSIELPMSIDQYYKDRYSRCNFTDVNRNDNPILYFNLMNLCTRGIISEANQERSSFYPTVNATLKELSKMVSIAAGIEKYSENQYPDGLICKEGKDCSGYIAGLFAKDIVEGEVEPYSFLFPLVGVKVVDPEEEVNRGKFIKMVIKAFFKSDSEKQYDCSSVTTGNKSYAWYCQYILAAKKHNLLFRDEDQELFGISDGEIDLTKKVKRGEAAILIDRARILKETGVEECLPD